MAVFGAVYKFSHRRKGRGPRPIVLAARTCSLRQSSTVPVLLTEFSRIVGPLRTNRYRPCRASYHDATLQYRIHYYTLTTRPILYSSSKTMLATQVQLVRHCDIHAAVGNASLLLVFLVNTFVIACLIVTPAFSVSFFDSPVVMHTFRAGCTCQPCSFDVLPVATGMLLRRVMSTPLARL